MRIRTYRRIVYDTAIAILSWIAGYSITRLFGHGLSSIANYSIIFGWWFTAYSSSAFQLSAISAALLGFLYIILFYLSYFFGSKWLFLDIDHIPFWYVVIVGFVQAIFISSPILFNAIFRKLIRFAGRSLGSRSD